MRFTMLIDKELRTGCKLDLRVVLLVNCDVFFEMHNEFILTPDFFSLLTTDY